MPEQNWLNKPSCLATDESKCQSQTDNADIPYDLIPDQLVSRFV